MPQQPIAKPQRIAARVADVGGMPVRRLLPTRERRTVGAWCFLDHAGPVAFEAGGGMHVGPHPHIGLQTFTWLIEGELLHSDSLGNRQWIRPGQVNVMTAGHGISHAEEAPEDRAGRSHAVQLWIALPDGQRECAPMFQHCPELPRIARGGFAITVLVGDWLGATAPATVFSPLLGADLRTDTSAATTLPLHADFEYAVLCLDGELRIDGEALVADTLLYLGLGRDTLHIETAAAAHLLLIGGTPFAEDVLIWWNFVGRTTEDMVQATHDWNHGDRFGEVPGTRLQRLAAPDVAGLQLRKATPT
ncbi:MAG: pirin family protein [Xanthomonadaceae bacterium]|nr:pirin family protein [Xanthomonadaceae bacterium]